MRILWIACLLIGSITCVPPQGGSGGMYMASSSGQGLSKPTYQKPSGQSASSGSHSGTNTAGGAGGYSVGGQDSQSGAPGGHYQGAQESWTSYDDEPVFTPVDAEDQVYAFKSRSRYNKKRLHFYQSHYTKTEPLEPQEPVFPYPGKTHQQSKGGF